MPKIVRSEIQTEYIDTIGWHFHEAYFDEYGLWGGLHGPVIYWGA